MKQTILTLSLLGLVACGGGSDGGSSTPAAKIADGGSITPSPTTTTTTLPAPLSYNSLIGNQLLSSVGSLSFSATQIIDGECTYTYDIQSINQVSANKIEVLTNINMPIAQSITLVQPYPCYFPVQSRMVLRMNDCVHRTLFEGTDVPFKIKYEIERVGSQYEITKTYTSRDFKMICYMPARPDYYENDSFVAPTRSYSH